MKLPIYQVDAFSDRVFGGNPAAVCPLDNWLDDKILQAIAAENNLAETVFFVPEESGYHIRWFTPTTEIELCGHATIASAFVLWTQLGFQAEELRFRAIAGELKVNRRNDLYELDFPSRMPVRTELSHALVEALGVEPDELWKSRDHMAVFSNEQQIRALNPDMPKLASTDLFSLIVTAPGLEADFVSRFFAPAQGINEDPVTGSSHCTLIPFWAERLGKKSMRALQVSHRGGELFCEEAGDRVKIAGRAALFLKGEIFV